MVRLSEVFRLLEADPPRRIVMPSAQASRPQTSTLGSSPRNSPPPPPKEDDPNALHPRLQRMRDEIKKTSEWVVGQLESGPKTDAFRAVIPNLKKLATLPSDQVLPILKAIGDQLAVLRRSTRTGNPSLSRAIDDAMMGVHTMMKAAGSLAASGMSDKGLFRNKVNGYMDKDGNFHATGTSQVSTESLMRPLRDVFRII